MFLAIALTENPLRFPPPDVIKRGRQAIQKYLKDGTIRFLNIKSLLMLNHEF